MREIVGVVGDIQVRPGWGSNGPLSAMPLVYVPVAQVSDGFVRLVHGWFMPTIAVRSPLSTVQVSDAIRRAVAAVDPLLPIASVRTMSEVRAASLGQQRLLTTLLLSLAVAALIVAAIGIHGLIAASVTERTREMGVRLALGSTLGQALQTLALPGVLLAGDRNSGRLAWGRRRHSPHSTFRLGCQLERPSDLCRRRLRHSDCGDRRQCRAGAAHPSSRPGHDAAPGLITKIVKSYT